MRNRLWLVAALTLLGGSVAMAQDQPPGDHNTRTDQTQEQRSGSRTEHPQAAQGREQSNKGQSRTAHAAPRKARPRRATAARGSHRFLSQGRYRASIRAPAFHYPSGYAYQRWTDGAILPRVFLADSYYYGDYAALGLGAPPGGYQWVRYGPDLLLVDVATGRIADVVDGVFY